jgi:hypothetical protein
MNKMRFINRDKELASLERDYKRIGTKSQRDEKYPLIRF